MISQRKNNTSTLIMSSIATICIVVVFAAFVLAEEHDTRQKTVIVYPSEQQKVKSNLHKIKISKKKKKFM